MSFDWEDYIRLSEELIKKTGDLVAQLSKLANPECPEFWRIRLRR